MYASLPTTGMLAWLSRSVRDSILGTLSILTEATIKQYKWLFMIALLPPGSQSLFISGCSSESFAEERLWTDTLLSKESDAAGACQACLEFLACLRMLCRTEVLGDAAAVAEDTLAVCATCFWRAFSSNDIT